MKVSPNYPLCSFSDYFLFKSDGPPALNARYLMYEAALVHYYGLPADVAIAALTTTPAEVAGYGHRLGYIKPGYDAGKSMRLYSRDSGRLNMFMV